MNAERMHRIGNAPKRKRVFMWYSLIAFGIPAATGMVWIFDAYGHWPLMAFVTAVSLGAAYAWGLLMWQFFVGPPK
ncbi:hypothetical protein ACFPOE_07330 [Caenimonas terrae]|uniref:Uncharacterized protein n=1 Tax=Caenimonas terrae TaxID=696074 RepID=A0ABW0N9W6_9BURK